MSLGKELANARNNADLTQAEVCHAVGISPWLLSQIEHDHKSPRVTLLLNLARVLGITITMNAEGLQIGAYRPKP